MKNEKGQMTIEKIKNKNECKKENLKDESGKMK